MNAVRTTITTFAAAVALSLVAACGTDVVAPANDIGGANDSSNSDSTGDKKSNNGSGTDSSWNGGQPQAPAERNLNRMDFNDDGGA